MLHIFFSTISNFFYNIILRTILESTPIYTSKFWRLYKNPYDFKLIWSCEVIYTIQVRPICFIICCKIGLTIHDNIVMSIPQYTMHIMCSIAFNLMKTSPKNVIYAWSFSAHAYRLFLRVTSSSSARRRWIMFNWGFLEVEVLY